MQSQLWLKQYSCGYQAQYLFCVKNVEGNIVFLYRNLAWQTFLSPFCRWRNRHSKIWRYLLEVRADCTPGSASLQKPWFFFPLQLAHLQERSPAEGSRQGVAICAWQYWTQQGTHSEVLGVPLRPHRGAYIRLSTAVVATALIKE